MRDLPDNLLDRPEMLLAPGRMLLEDGPATGMAALVRDGRFAEIATVAELTARHPGLTPIALPDHLMMPGFIDSHTHLTQSLGKSLVFGEPSEIFRRIWVPLEGSLDQRMVYLSSKLAALECLRGGFTCAVDAGTRSAGRAGDRHAFGHRTDLQRSWGCGRRAAPRPDRRPRRSAS